MGCGILFISFEYLFLKEEVGMDIMYAYDTFGRDIQGQVLEMLVRDFESIQMIL